MRAEDIAAQIIDKCLTALMIGGLGWVIKQWFNSINQRITDLDHIHRAANEDLSTRISAMEGKYRDVLDIVLTKFSKYEDRILGLIAKIQSADPKEIEREVEELRIEHKSEFETMKLRVERVSTEVQKIANEPVTESAKEYLHAYNHTLRVEFDAKMKVVQDELEKYKRILAVFNLKQKDHNFKLENLIAMKGTKSGSS